MSLSGGVRGWSEGGVLFIELDLCEFEGALRRTPCANGALQTFWKLVRSTSAADKVGSMMASDDRWSW